MSRRRLIALIVGVIALIIVIYVGYIISITSFIRVEVSGSVENLTVSITNQTSDETVTETITETTSFTLKKGSYQVLVNGKDGGYFSVLQTNGFLGTETVTPVLTQAYGEESLGTDTDTCLQLVSLLISYECGGSGSSLGVHLPATGLTPSYKTLLRPTDGNTTTTVEGVFTLNQTTYVMLQLAATQRTFGRHALYRVVIDGAASRLELIQEFRQFNPNTLYRVVAYGNGFIMHNDSFSEVLYIENISDLGSVRVVSQTFSEIAALSGLKSLRVQRETLLVTVVNTVNTADDDSTSVFVGNLDTLKPYEFNRAYIETALCGVNRLCGVAASGLDIIDLSSNSVTMTVTGVKQAIGLEDNTVAAATDMAVLLLNPDTKDGFPLFSMGNLSFKSLQNEGGTLLVNVASKNSRFVLRLADNLEPSPLPKLVTELESKFFVRTVSIYKNSVFITPSVGELEYNPQTNDFEYPAARRQEASRLINEFFKSSGINTRQYQVVNTIP